MKVHQNLSHFFNPRKTSKYSKLTEELQRQSKNRQLDKMLKKRSVIDQDTRNGPSKRRKSTTEEEDNVEHAQGSDGKNKANVVEERMGRATQEAAGEDRGSFPGDDEHEDDNSVSEAEAIPKAKRPETMRKPHLPDKLFEAAFSSKTGKRKVEEDEVPLDCLQKKRKSKSKKDIVAG